MHRAQVFHEAVRAQDPAHLAQEHEEAVRPFGASPHPFSVPREGSLTRPPRIMAGRRYPYPRRLTFQPVALKVLPALPMVSVRSHIPGRLAAQGQRERLLSPGGGAGEGRRLGPGGHAGSQHSGLHVLISYLPNLAHVS